jgi:copper oxidase (laccase) domain-containing protein
MKIMSWETKYGKLETYTEKPSECIYLKQVHGADFIHVTDEFLSSHNSGSPPEADGFLYPDPIPTKSPFALQTADCIPALIEGEHGWALMHLGWRGLAKKMSIADKVKELKATHLWIGPHILVESYEVSKDFTNNFPLSDNFNLIQDKIYFNMQQELIDQVQSFAPDVLIKKSPLCTFHHQQLHSYRENGTKKRNWTILTSKSS